MPKNNQNKAQLFFGPQRTRGVGIQVDIMRLQNSILPTFCEPTFSVPSRVLTYPGLLTCSCSSGVVGRGSTAGQLVSSLTPFPAVLCGTDGRLRPSTQSFILKVTNKAFSSIAYRGEGEMLIVLIGIAFSSETLLKCSQMFPEQQINPQKCERV